MLSSLRPRHEGDGLFSPSPFARRIAVRPGTRFAGAIEGNRRFGPRDTVLVLCTEEGRMDMANGTRFATGNHPVELLFPLMHLDAAGYDFRVLTPTGRPVAIEEWAMPRGDAATMDFRARHEDRLRTPGSAADFIARGMPDATRVAAVFVPGGHGAMLGLPFDRNIGEVLLWAHGAQRLTLAICHGPAAFLSMRLAGAFPYAGYSIAAFPDRADRIAPMAGYLPGPMPWYFNARLRHAGMRIVNHLPTGRCHRDRRLITGDSPEAANTFGRMAAEALLDADSA